MNVSGAVVLVTGASGGIGAACAAELTARGARLVISGRAATPLAAVPGVAVTADLAEPDGAEKLADDARAVFGRVDAVIHCAGVGWYGDFPEMPVERLDEVVAVNVLAPMLLTRALLPDMVARGCGHVAFLASIAGWTGVARESAYAGAKAGLITFAESLRLELAGTGVGVSVVSPGAVRTDFYDRRGEPYDRRVPRPVPAQRIAHSVARGVERERANQIVPRWLAIAPAVRAVAPGAYRRLIGRFG